jgi:hypothetical protein
MAYSDYGSYNWKKENGKWVYKPEFEDANLLSQITGEEISKETSEFLGMKLKLGAVKGSKDLEEKYPDLPYEIVGTHHSVIGDLKNYAIVSFKGRPKVLYKGKVAYEFKETDLYTKNYDSRKKIKTIHFCNENCEVKLTIDTSENFWSVAYIKNNNDEYLSICGYGLGEHWWLNEEGKEVSDDNDSDERECFDVDMNPIPNPHYRWPREKECLKRSLKILKLN